MPSVPSSDLPRPPLPHHLPLSYRILPLPTPRQPANGLRATLLQLCLPDGHLSVILDGILSAP